MKNVLILLSLFLVIASCKKCEELDCEGPDCLLTNGSNCPPNMYIENNQCICPADFIWLNDSLCLEKDNNTDIAMFYTTFDCECVNGDIILGFDTVNQFAGVYSLNGQFEPTGQNRIGGPFSFLPGAWRGNFNALLYPAKCDGNDLYMHGYIDGDTLTYELFFINSSTLDTCGPFQSLAF